MMQLVGSGSFQTDAIFQSGVLTAYILTMSFALGTVLGSFFNCMAWRMAHGESVVKGRSHCAVCGHTLGLPDLVPVFSYVLLKGKCRYCGEKISPRYMLAEVFLGIVFVLSVLKWGLSPELVRYLALACILFTISLIDLDIYMIPNRLILAGIIAYFITLPFVHTGIAAGLVSGLIGGFVIGGAIFLLVIIFEKITGKESMGGGDIKLFFMTGLYTGAPGGLLMVLVSCIFGLLFAAMIKNKRIPFGPSISAAAYLVLLSGEPVLNWYLSLF